MSFRKKIQNRVITSKPVKHIIHRSKKVYMPGFEGYSLHDLWEPVSLQLKRHNIFERAAAISFNVFMAIPPTLIFIFTLVPYLPISSQFMEEIFILIRDIVPGEENNVVIIDFLRDFLTKPRNELLSFGLFLALFFSSSAMLGVIRTFDKNYKGFKKRGWYKKRRTAIMLTMYVFILVFLCILLLIAQGIVLEWIGIENRFVRSLIDNFRWLILLFLVFYTVSYIYRHAPAHIKRWPFVTPGSVVATVFMVLATLLVSYWVDHFNNYNKLYGSISAIFILMSLIYVNSLAILFGFELNVTIAELREQKEVEKVIV